MFIANVTQGKKEKIMTTYSAAFGTPNYGKGYVFNPKNTSFSWGAGQNSAPVNVPVGQKPITDPARMLPPHQPTIVNGNTSNYVDNGFRFYEHPGMNDGTFGQKPITDERRLLPQYAESLKEDTPKPPVPPKPPVKPQQSKLKFIHECGQYKIKTDKGTYLVDKSIYEAAKKTGKFDPAKIALDNARRGEQAGRFQGTSQKAMDELHGIGRESENTKYFRELEQAEKGVKKGGFWNKVGKFFKGKGGKLALIAGAIGLGALLLSKCTGGKKDEAPQDGVLVPPQPPENNSTPVVPPVVEPDVPVVPEQTEVTAVKGDDYWKYAEMELIAEHQGEANYSPSTKEIEARKLEIMGRKGIKMAKDGVHSDPLLMTNDEVILKGKTAELRNEAIRQLKEEHQNQPGYEPTYKEVRKKYNELLAAA